MKDFADIFNFRSKLFVNKISFDVSIFDVVDKTFDYKPSFDKIRYQIVVTFTLVVNCFEKASELKRNQIDFRSELLNDDCHYF